MQEHKCPECGIAMALVRVLPALAVCCLLLSTSFADTIPVTLEDDEAERYLGYRAGH